MTDQFTQIYSLLNPAEEKRCRNYFKLPATGEKERALFEELRKMKNRSSDELAEKIYGDRSRTTLDLSNSDSYNGCYYS